MNVAQNLLAARHLIDSPDKWLKASFACTTYNEPCQPIDGAKFCPLGALSRVTGNDVVELFSGQYLESKHPLEVYYLRKALRQIGQWNGSIVFFNDDPHREHEDIMQMFDVAIDLAKRDGANAEAE